MDGALEVLPVVLAEGEHLEGLRLFLGEKALDLRSVNHCGIETSSDLRRQLAIVPPTTMTARVEPVRASCPDTAPASAAGGPRCHAELRALERELDRLRAAAHGIDPTTCDPGSVCVVFTADPSAA